MKALSTGLSLLGLAALVAGCSPELAQAPYGSEEARWLQAFQENYSGYRPPRIAPPAIVDNVSPRLVEAEQQAAAPAAPAVDPAAPAVLDDPAAVVDQAAEKDNAPAGAKPEAKPEAKAEVKADAGAKPEAKPEAKSEAKTEVKADAANPPDPTSSTVYEVKSGDTLGAIAKKVYGSVGAADVIRRANSDIIKNPNQLRPGMKLIIPKL